MNPTAVNRSHGAVSEEQEPVWLLSDSPIAGFHAQCSRCQQAYGNLVSNFELYPELTSPIDTTIFNRQLLTLAGLTGVVPLGPPGPALVNTIPVNEWMSSVSRVSSVPLMPGLLIDLVPSPIQDPFSRAEFKPYLEFVGPVGSTREPVKKSINLDLDEYQ